jgi:glyoxylase-like metal-dependent hydrolase (beta-lactamase superfamily II)
MLPKPSRGSLTLAIAFGAAIAFCSAPPRTLAQAPASPAGGSLQVLKVRPNFYMLAGAGGNIALQIGDDGVVVVNTGLASMSDQVAAAISQLAPGKGVVQIINTGSDADLIGGNIRLQKLRPPGWPATTVLSTQEALNRMVAAGLPQEGQPGDSMLVESRKPLYYNGEGIEVLRAPAAHSDGDLMVFFRRSDVLVTGDVIDTEDFPSIDLANGGSLRGELDALNNVVETAIPSIPYVAQAGGTLIIPGHGRLYEQADAVQYRDMVTIIRDRVQALIGNKQTLAQVQKAGPALGYQGEYGKAAGSASDFVASVYRSLVKQPAFAALQADTGVTFK